MLRLLIAAVVLLSSVLGAPVTSGPEQVHIGLTSDVTQRTVSWVTPTATSSSVVQYGLSASALSSAVTAENITFVDGGSDHRTIYIHNALLDALRESTVYYYRCGSPSGGYSAVFNFTTFAKDQPIQFAVFGDAGVKNFRTLDMLQSQSAAGAFDAVLHVGDFAYNMNDDQGRVGDSFMEMIEPIAAARPYVTVLGNHESAYNFSHYTERFSNNAMQANSGNNWYYSVNVGLAHIVGFSSEVYYNAYLNDVLVAQYKWLEDDLSKVDRTRTPWVIAMAHRPIYCSNVDDLPDCTTDAQKMRNGFPINGTAYPIDDLFEKYHVDLYLTAHEHSYERTLPVFNNTAQAQADAHVYHDSAHTVNIVTGAAGCPEDLDYYSDIHNAPWSLVRSASYGFGHLQAVNASHLHWIQYEHVKSTHSDGSTSEKAVSIDELWMVSSSAHTHRPINSHTVTAHTGAPRCSHYCYAVCARRSPVQQCVDQCSCAAEQRAGVLASLGDGIVAKRSKILRH